jgi:biopolymer transport protein ExbD
MTELAKGNAEMVVVISADAKASHQSVINVMEAARRAGLARITFSTQSTSD